MQWRNDRVSGRSSSAGLRDARATEQAGLLALVGGAGFLLSPGACEHAGDGVIPFMTGVLVERVRRLPQGNHQCPRLGPRRRIAQRDLILEAVGTLSRNAFDHVKVLGRTSVVGLVREARR